MCSCINYGRKNFHLSTIFTCISGQVVISGRDFPAPGTNAFYFGAPFEPFENWGLTVWIVEPNGIIKIIDDPFLPKPGNDKFN